MIVQNAVPRVLPEQAEVYRLSVDQYHKMIAAGVFSSDDKLELLEGYLVLMNPVGDGHLYTVDELYLQLLRLIPPGWKVFMQHPIRLGGSEPEPDLVVVRGSGSDYKRRKPSAEHVGLLVEVADSSLLYDSVTKLGMYAAAGISEYWIVNLVDRQVDIYQRPQPARDGIPAAYVQHEVVDAVGVLKLVLDGKIVGDIQVDSILP